MANLNILLFQTNVVVCATSPLSLRLLRSRNLSYMVRMLVVIRRVSQSTMVHFQGILLSLSHSLDGWTASDPRP